MALLPFEALTLVRGQCVTYTTHYSQNKSKDIVLSLY